MSLDAKIDGARQLLREVLDRHGPRRVAVAWTGGKDSTLALTLWRGVLRDGAPGARPLALNLDTGCKFPEVLAFRDRLADEWGVEMHIARPDVAPGYPVAVDRAACCRDLKVTPLLLALRRLDVAVLVTGIRRDEHPDRAARPAREPVAEPPHLRVHPVLDFTEMDVWAATMQLGLPHCELYGRGYRSLGCMPCTLPPEMAGDAGQGAGGERAGRAADKEAVLASLHALGYF
ncbi:phosphoadenosine phosphosulfate reductase family protein [Nitratidesulfovibrio sp. D1]|uniref:phosphoadenosine phosphosulfate reductase family protein n=1 Tax=Nitratidesulfovibrio sp. D1 TaxID=3440151 RepID=UPI003EB79ABD